jgi:hypothetical protein
MTFRQTDGAAVAAAKAAISPATADRFEPDHRLPPAVDEVRTRRRPDPLADFFDTEVIPLLKAAPDLRAVAIFEEMQRRHPHLSPGARRTLERRIRSWRAEHGADQEVIFRQDMTLPCHSMRYAHGTLGSVARPPGFIGFHRHGRSGRHDRRRTARSSALSFPARILWL